MIKYRDYINIINQNQVINITCIDNIVAFAFGFNDVEFYKISDSNKKEILKEMGKKFNRLYKVENIYSLNKLTGLKFYYL